MIAYFHLVILVSPSDPRDHRHMKPVINNNLYYLDYLDYLGGICLICYSYDMLLV